MNHGGAANYLVFYRGPDATLGGVKADASRPHQRKMKLTGLNGPFMTLFVLRTASSLRVTSTVFGKGKSTGGTGLHYLD